MANTAKDGGTVDNSGLPSRSPAIDYPPFPILLSPPGLHAAAVDAQVSVNSSPRREYRVVVGLNFGTTHTSVSYLLDHNQHNANIQERIDGIRIVQDWPCHESGFVPTQISYSPSPKGCRQWGYDIDDESYVHKDLRLHLEDGSKYDELVRLRDLVQEAATDSDLFVSVSPRLYKSPEVMAADYLRNIAETFRDELDRHVGRHVKDNIPIDLVVSYPSLWPNTTKQRYFQVIESAFNHTILSTLRHIYFVAEAEAVAQLCVFSQYNFLAGHGIRKNTSVIVCDTEGAGMQAVAASYAFDQVESDFKLRKIGYVARADAGWRLVEQEFGSLLLVERSFGFSYLYERTHSMVGSNWEKIFSRFRPIMHGFKGMDQNPFRYPIMLPRGFTDNRKNGIVNGALALSNEDIKKMFEPSIKSCIQMISDQIDLADHSGTPAKAIILNGSFVNQAYVFRRLRDFAQTRGIPTVGAEGDGNTARGAVLHALGLSINPMSPITKLRHHYGIAYGASGPPSNTGGQENQTPRFEWVLSRGEAIFHDEDEPRLEMRKLQQIHRVEDIKSSKMSRVVAICGQDTLSDDLHGTARATRTLDLDFNLSLIPQTEQSVATWKGRFFGHKKSLWCSVKLSVGFRVRKSIVTVHVSCGETLLVERDIPDELAV